MVSLGLLVAGGWVVYLAALAIYRLYISPIAKFPGPKLAALSRWYEFYYEVVLRGQFTFHIQDLHKKYGLLSDPKGMPVVADWAQRPHRPYKP